MRRIATRLGLIVAGAMLGTVVPFGGSASSGAARARDAVAPQCALPHYYYSACWNVTFVNTSGYLGGERKIIVYAAAYGFKPDSQFELIFYGIKPLSNETASVYQGVIGGHDDVSAQRDYYIHGSVEWQCEAGSPYNVFYSGYKLNGHQYYWRDGSFTCGSPIRCPACDALQPRRIPADAVWSARRDDSSRPAHLYSNIPNTGSISHHRPTSPVRAEVGQILLLPTEAHWPNV